MSVSPNKGHVRATCKRGHDDWIIDNSGERRCKTCRGMQRKREDSISKHGNGGREDTYTFTEIMKARGYV